LAGQGRLPRLVADLEHSYARAAACLAEDLQVLWVHLEYPLRLRRRLRSTSLLESPLEEVKRRTKVIGRFPGETSCLSLSWAVLDLFIASARGLALTALGHRQLAQMRAATTAQTPGSLTAQDVTDCESCVQLALSASLALAPPCQERRGATAPQVSAPFVCLSKGGRHSGPKTSVKRYV
jgi:hypothetical protein